MSGSGDAPDHSMRTRVITVVVGVVLLLVLALVVTRVVDSGPSADGPTAAEPSPSPASPSPTPEPTDATPRDAPPPGQSGSDGAGAPADEGEDGGDGSSDQAVNNQPPVRVPLREVAVPEPGLRIAVTEVEKVRSRAEIPGETSRPALRITVRADNTSDEVVAIGGALTNLYFGPDRDAATLVLRPGGRPFPPDLAPGDSATSVVVYNVPPEARDDVVLEVSLDAAIRRVEFSGNCAADC